MVVCFPGGFGTMDEFFESMTLIQTLKVARFPVVCIGHHFWDGLCHWVRHTLLESYHHISPEDMDLFRITDDVDEAVSIISECFEDRCWLTAQPEIPEHAAAPTAEGTRVGIDPRFGPKDHRATK